MDNSSVAILVSLISVGVAALSLGWNIYRDIVAKPKVAIGFGVSEIIIPNLNEKRDYISLSATNYGPGSVTISAILLKNTSLWKRLSKTEKLAEVIPPDHSIHFSDRLPAKLGVGDKTKLFLPYDENCLLREEWTHVGVCDYYEKSHWATRKEIQEARQRWLQDFDPNRVA